MGAGFIYLFQLTIKYTIFSNYRKREISKEPNGSPNVQQQGTCLKSNKHLEMREKDIHPKEKVEYIRPKLTSL